MRILHMHKYFHDRDGASRYARGLMRLEERAGHAVVPFAMHDPRNIFTPWSRYFVSYEDTRRVRFGLGAFRQLGRALWSHEAKRRATELCDVFHPDIIHAHNLYTHLSPSVLDVAFRREIPVVMTVHDYALVSANYSVWDGRASMDTRRLGLFATTKTRAIKHSYSATFALEAIRLLQRRLRLYDRAIARYLVSSSFMTDVLVRSGIQKDKIVHIPLFSPPLLDGTPNVTTGPRARTVVFAGRLEGYKGVEVLVDALRFLPKDMTVEIIGTGPDEARIAARVAGDSRVKMLGFLPGDALWARMAAARAVVVPSLWNEPFGLVPLEAMTFGTPVIVSSVGGLPEIVQDGGGMVVPAGDPKALARAIVRLLDDEHFARTLGLRAAQVARTLGDPEAHLARVLLAYHACG